MSTTPTPRTIAWLESMLITTDRTDDYAQAVDAAVAHLTDDELDEHGIETVEAANIRIGNAAFYLDLVPRWRLDVLIDQTRSLTTARREFLAEFNDEAEPNSHERTLLRTLRRWEAALELEGMRWSGVDDHAVYVPGIKLAHSRVGIPPTRTTADRKTLITEITEITDRIWWPNGQPDAEEIHDLLDEKE